MYVWAAFEAKSLPIRQALITLINNYTLYFYSMPWTTNNVLNLISNKKLM